MGWKKYNTSNSDIETWKKSYFRFCGTISKENIIEIFLFFVHISVATAAKNNKLPFSCFNLCEKKTSTQFKRVNEWTNEMRRERKKEQSEGKFNQVIKHFLLKHQLNLMVFLLPLLLYAGKSRRRAVNNSEGKSYCNRSHPFHYWRFKLKTKSFE